MEHRRKHKGIRITALFLALIMIAGTAIHFIRAGRDTRQTAAELITASAQEPETVFAPEVISESETVSAPMDVTTASAPTAASSAPRMVSIYSVASINNRKRSMIATRASSHQATQEMQETMAAHGQLRYEYVRLDDIPMVEVYRDDGEVKPLLIFLHGLGLGKDSLLPVLSAYAEAGFYAVAIDAYDQGERYTRMSNVDSWAAMLITVGDVDAVVAYYQTVPQADSDKFVLGGFSMGGVETWAYTEIGNYKPTAIVTMSGMCEYNVWQRWEQEKLSYSWLRPWKTSVWAFPQRQEWSYTTSKYNSISSLNITNNLDSFRDIPIFACIGTMDKYFNAWSAEYVARTITQYGNEDVTFIKYEGVTHEITDQMIEDSLTFLEAYV